MEAHVPRAAAVLLLLVLLSTWMPTSRACEFDGTEPCALASNVTLAGSDDLFEIPVVGSSGSTLNYSCASALPTKRFDLLVLSDEELLQFAVAHVLPASLRPGTHLNTTGASVSLSFLVTTALHVVLYNRNASDPVMVRFSLAYDPSTADTCWGFVAAFGVPVVMVTLLLFVVLLCGVRVLLPCCGSERERGRAAGMRFTDGDVDETQPLRAEEAIPVAGSDGAPESLGEHVRDRLPPSWRGLPCCDVPRVSVGRYVCENHDLLWPWFPAYDEVLPFAARAGCVVATLLFQLLVQTVWAAAFLKLQVVLSGDLQDLLRTSVGGMAARVAVGALASSLFALLFVPLIRLLHRCAWRTSPVQWKRRAALAIDAAVLCGVLVLTALFAYYCSKLLRIYSCDALLMHQLVPFVLSVAIKSVFPGILVIVGWYFVSAALGRRTRPGGSGL